MKSFVVYLLTLAACASAAASPGPLPAANATAAATDSKALMNAGAVRFQFNKIASSAKDSVLIIFDRYDRTGAGVIYKKFAADDAQGIDIALIPAGKYYVTIQCLGLHHDRMEKLVTVKAKKNGTVRIALGDVAEFSKDNVVIPAYRPDFSDLAILKTK